jgi:SSS family solute:Na+ symporter
MPLRMRKGAVCIALVLTAISQIAGAAVPAAGITEVRTEELPPLPIAVSAGAEAPAGAENSAGVEAWASAGAPAVRLVVLDGEPVALQASSSWKLDDAGKRWTELRWQPAAPQNIRGVVQGDRRAFVLLGAGEAVERLAEVTLAGDALALHPLPPFPSPLANAVAAERNSTLYVAGHDASGAPQLLTLSLAEPTPTWRRQPPWPSGERPTSLAVQNGAVYLTVLGVNATERVLRWSAKDSWVEKGATPGALIPGSARALGQAHILHLVRTSGTNVQLKTFHTISGSWATLPFQASRLPVAATPAAAGLFVAFEDAGQITFQHAQLVSGSRMLRVADWAVIIVYLAGMIGIGLYFHTRDKKGSAAEFFVGNRAIPVWAAGVSLYATNTSSISYVAIPAKAFETNWTYLSNNLVTVLGLMFVATWVVPLLRRLDLVSVFSYLEMRFHPTIRVLASALCILMQVGSRMSVVLFLPALAIATITGLDVVWSILIMGVSTIIYTTLGGMRAVIWTDFLQVIVMFGGALFAIGFVFYTLGGGAVIETALANQKTKLFDFSFDLTQASIWGFFILVLLDVVLTFPKDQVLMQRALATNSGRSAGRSIWIFAAMTIPGGFIFYSIGTALFAYYQARPDRIDPLLPIDATFPLFIAAELPIGITGLIIAGIFAAAMSTLSGTINSVATLLAVDFYGRVAKEPTQEQSLRFAEWASVVVGLVGIVLALMLSRYDVHSLLDMSIELAGLLGGGFAGAYTLGMFTRRANSAGVTIGIATAIVVTLIAWLMKLVHPYFYLGISIFTCIVVGYLASLLFPPPTRSLAGLTVRIGEEAPATQPAPARD